MAEEDMAFEMAPMADGGAAGGMPRTADNNAANEASTTTSSGSGRDTSSSAPQETTQEEDIETDFMTGIPPSTRYWAHQLRPNYSPTTRIDMTETLLFSTA